MVAQPETDSIACDHFACSLLTVEQSENRRGYAYQDAPRPESDHTLLRIIKTLSHSKTDRQKMFLTVMGVRSRGRGW
jgi:hypothetical protein